MPLENFFQAYFQFAIPVFEAWIKCAHCRPITGQESLPQREILHGRKSPSQHGCETPSWLSPHAESVRIKTNKRRPQGVLTRTGPQTVMPKSYKLLRCLNKTHINLSLRYFSAEISHFEVLPFNLHLTFVSCAPRRPTLTAEAFRSQKRPAAIDGISAHLSAPAPRRRVKDWLLFPLPLFCHSPTGCDWSSASGSHFKTTLIWS